MITVERPYPPFTPAEFARARALVELDARLGPRGPRHARPLLGTARRGIGSELLGRPVAMAVEAGCESVYAVTQAHNTGMVAAMRGLSLPLDYRIEEGTLVTTARPTASRVRTLPYGRRTGQAG